MTEKTSKKGSKSIAKPVSYWVRISPSDIEQFKRINPGFSVTPAASLVDRGLPTSAFGQGMKALSPSDPYTDHYLVWPAKDSDNVFVNRAPVVSISSVGGFAPRRLGVVLGAKHGDQYIVSSSGEEVDVTKVGLLLSTVASPGFGVGDIGGATNTEGVISRSVEDLCADLLREGRVSVAVMDTETTGLDANDLDSSIAAELTQVTALLVEMTYDPATGVIETNYLDCMDIPVKPEYPLSKKLMQLTHKDEASLAAASPAHEVVERMESFLAQHNIDHIAFHNASFDIAQLATNGFDFKGISIVDTLKSLASASFAKNHPVPFFKQQGNNSQIQALMRIYNIPIEQYGKDKLAKNYNDTLQARLNELCHDSMVDVLLLSLVLSGLTAAGIGASAFVPQLSSSGPVYSIVNDAQRLGDKLVAILKTLFYSGPITISALPTPGVAQTIRDILDGYTVDVPSSPAPRKLAGIPSSSAPSVAPGASPSSESEDIPEELRGLTTGL